MKRKILLAAAAMAVGANAMADVVVFKNGDKLTGTVVELVDGKLKLNSPAVGDVLIDTLDIQTFSTDGLIDLQLADGVIVKQKVEAGSDGKITIIGIGGQTEYEISSLKSINPRTGWRGNVRGGLSIQNGNSKNEDYYFAFDLLNRTETDRYIFGGDYNLQRRKNSDTGNRESTTDNWKVFGQWDHFFDEKLYGYGRVQVDHDSIANLKYRVSPGIGLGYQWHESPIWNFTTEGGLNYVYERYDDDDSDPDFDNDNSYIAVRGAYRYDRKLNDKVLLFHNFEIIPSIEDPVDVFTLTTDLGVRANMTNNMFTEARVELKHNSEPAAGSSKSDVRWIVSVGWAF